MDGCVCRVMRRFTLSSSAQRGRERILHSRVYLSCTDTFHTVLLSRERERGSYVHGYVCRVMRRFTLSSSAQRGRERILCSRVCLSCSDMFHIVLSTERNRDRESYIHGYVCRVMRRFTFVLLCTERKREREDLTFTDKSVV